MTGTKPELHVLCGLLCIHLLKKTCKPCADAESFVGGVPTLIIFFFGGGGGGEVSRTAKSGQLSACQRNAFEMAFHWWGDNGRH